MRPDRFLKVSNVFQESAAVSTCQRTVTLLLPRCGAVLDTCRQVRKTSTASLANLGQADLEEGPELRVEKLEDEEGGPEALRLSQDVEQKAHVQRAEVDRGGKGDGGRVVATAYLGRYLRKRSNFFLADIQDAPQPEMTRCNTFTSYISTILPFSYGYGLCHSKFTHV